MSKLRVEIEEMGEQFFRSYYVPLYPVDKPISEMTPTEQGLYKSVTIIVSIFIGAFPKLAEQAGYIPKEDAKHLWIKRANIILKKIIIQVIYNEMYPIKGNETAEELSNREINAASEYLGVGLKLFSVPILHAKVDTICAKFKHKIQEETSTTDHRPSIQPNITHGKCEVVSE